MRAIANMGAAGHLTCMTNFSSLFEPNYTILTFLMIKTFFFIEGIGALGLIRALSAARSARLFGAVTALFAILCIAAKYVPPVAGLTGTEPARLAANLINAGVFQVGSGMAAPLAITALFAISAVVPGRRWWGLDALFALCCVGFYGLWIYTLL